MRQVTKEVEKQEESIKKEVLTFSNDVNHYAKNQMAMSFTDLYKASVPIILICAFVSLLFWEGRALSKREGKDSRRSVKGNRLLLACFFIVFSLHIVNSSIFNIAWDKSSMIRKFLE